MTKTEDEIIVQGHRGCRGVFPENSIEGFLHAVDLGVSTLEMDVVITGDHKVVVSHEPFFNGEICTHPDGSLIPESEGSSILMYGMRYDSIRNYPCGTIPHPRFPNQKQSAYHKPLLREVIEAVRRHCEGKGIGFPAFNIEAKNQEAWYGTVQPSPEQFASLLIDELSSCGLLSGLSLQSFDLNMLRELGLLSGDIPLVLLNENPAKDLDELINKLGFKPSIYSPEYVLVDDDLMKDCARWGIDLSVWTVNDRESMEKLIDMGVRDIITDYPDELLNLAKERRLKVKH